MASSAQSTPQEQLVQQGIDRYQAGKFAEAIALWEQALGQIARAEEQAIVLGNLAVAYRETGKLERAIARWEQAIEIYRSGGDASQRQIPRLLTEQAQAYSDLGQHRRAIALLLSATEIAGKFKDNTAEAAARGALGNAYWALGDYKQALEALDLCLKIARALNDRAAIGTALNNRGNVYASLSDRYRYQASLADMEGEEKNAANLTQQAEQNISAALKDFEQSVRVGVGLESELNAERLEINAKLAPIAVGGMTQVRALLNINRLLARSPARNPDLIASNRNRVLALLEKQPDSREKAYALINIGDGIRRQQRKDETAISQLSIEILETATNIARNIGDRRAESFAIGSLGQLYELAGQYNKAIELTRSAADAAQQINAADSLYLWQWQTGRIFKATGNIEGAIAQFQQAIATLQSIRGDIVAANKELQFNFRDDVEPIYRGLMDLLLAMGNGEKKSQKSKVKSQISISPISQSNALNTVIDTLELLKLAELQNFFGDDCVQVALSNADTGADLSQTNTAAIYSVILDDRTETILKRPDGTMTSYRAEIGALQMQQEIDQLRTLLEKRETDEYPSQAKKVYDLLIRPMEKDLAKIKPRTLVFINDGVLRQVPIAALYDGKQFLIEKYAIATAPSLSLTAAKPLNRQNLKTLALGLTVEKPPFAALTNVSAEIKGVQQIMSGTQLVDRDFTLSNLQAKLQKESYPVVHIATHGKFGVDAESTFLVGFDKNISIEEMDNLLRVRGGKQPVELLTLSACQTATGDNRSALGIAGVAVRAGVGSAVATLWYINDAATVPLIEEFYRQLRQPNVTKAEALQKAQLKAIADENYKHPAVWSPFILIGNWL